MKILLAILIFLSISKASFYYDRSLSKNIGRNFIGSSKYGSFEYNLPCPLEKSNLPEVSIAAASSSGNCFTDDSTAELNVGYICEPGTTNSIIHFGYPDSATGFIIGGSGFVSNGILTAKQGYTWGSIGTPDYTTGSATVTCTNSCSSTYCGGTCTASCTDSKSSTGENCADTIHPKLGVEDNVAGTVYFIPSSLITANPKFPTNCGSLGLCCSSFSFPFCKGGIFDFTFTDVLNWAGTYEFGSIFSSSVPGVVTHLTYNHPRTSLLTYIASLWDSSDQSLVGQVTFDIFSDASNLKQIKKLLNPVTIVPDRKYVVTINARQTDFAYYSSNPTVGKYLTYHGAAYSNFAHGIYPGNSWFITTDVDVVFETNNCSKKRKLDSEKINPNMPLMTHNSQSQLSPLSPK